MNKRYSLLLSSVLALFAILFLMLCYYNRLATDDYYFIWDVRNHGIAIGVTSQYMEWCGRFAATFAMDVFYKWFDIHYSYYAFLTVASALLLFSGVYFILSNLVKCYNLHFPNTQKALSAACFTALLFFLSVDIGESWFWFCSYSSYLWSIVAFIWGMAFLISKKNTFLSGLGAVFCFIYVGGASEVYTAIYGLLLTILLFRNYRNAGAFRIFVQEPFNKKLTLAYIAMGISFLIFLIAPGNYLRDGLFPDHPFFYSFFITAKSFVKFGALYLPFKLPYILAFAFPFIIFGQKFRSSDLPFFHHSFKAFFYRISFSFAILLFVFFYMVAFVMVETGPPRIWFLLSFLLAVYSCVVCFYAGYKLDLSLMQLQRIRYLTLTAGFLLMIYALITQFSTASAYAAAHDERVEHIVELNNVLKKDTLIRLSPLPRPGMLYSGEIASDSNHFTNKELRLGYNLRYHVICSE
jgi:hypothetical protein